MKKSKMTRLQGTKLTKTLKEQFEKLGKTELINGTRLQMFQKQIVKQQQGMNLTKFNLIMFNEDSFKWVSILETFKVAVASQEFLTEIEKFTS